eukprot:15199761-Ditylum_brightwellii.AAC.1
MAHDGSGDAMLAVDMDKSLSKGLLIMEINSTTKKNPLSCSMDEYNSMRKESNFSTIPFVVLQKDLLDSTTTSLEKMFHGTE